MSSAVLEIIWDKSAWESLSALYDYIKDDSLQNAENVRNEIIQKVDSINSNPIRFGLDKFKTNNDGSYRYFEIHRQRVAFRITKNTILILRIRSTYQEPKMY